jgi:hypothetical protein
MNAGRVINLKQRGAKQAVGRDEFPSAHADAPLISWQARDHVPQERSWFWYAGVVVIAAVLALWAIWTFNFLFAFFMLAAMVALLAASSRQASMYRIAVFPHGIEIEGLPTLAFTDVESFWMFPGTTPTILSLRPRHKIKFPTYLLLENVDAEKVREVLLNYIPEHEEELPFIERIHQLLGF